VVAPVGVITVAFDLLRGNNDPLSVLPSPCEQRLSDVLDLSRVAILLVAAALGWLVRHVPSAVELFVELHISRRMIMILSLSRERRDKRANEQKCIKGTHDELPIKGRTSAINAAVRMNGQS